MALEGTLQMFALPEVFKMISAQKKTGILTIQGEQDIIAISFLAGEVVAADALNQTVEDGLGQVLVSQGLVEPERFAQLAAEHHSGNVRLVDLLVERGVLDRSQLLDSLRIQTYQLLLQVLAWKVGEFKFYGGDEVSFEEGLQPIPVEEIFVRAACDLGDLSGLVGAALPAPDDILAPTPEALEQLAQGALVYPDGMGPLSAEEEGLLPLLDGRRTVAELADTTGLGTYKTSYALQRLTQGRLVVSVFAAADRGSFESHEDTAAGSADPPPAVRSAPRLELPVGAIRTVLSGAVAAVLAVLLIQAFLRPVVSPFLPFPWQAAQRDAFTAVQRDSRYLKIDRAARSNFLLEGRYPETLESLRDAGLIGAGDLVDPRGRRLVYQAEEIHYSVAPLGSDGQPIEAEGLAEAVSGDFLLDPEMVQGRMKTDEPPLVLLD